MKGVSVKGDRDSRYRPLKWTFLFQELFLKYLYEWHCDHEPHLKSDRVRQQSNGCSHEIPVIVSVVYCTASKQWNDQSPKKLRNKTFNSQSGVF